MCLKCFAYIIPFLPEIMGRGLVKKAFSSIDLVYSNIPFSSEPWYLCNKEVK